MAHSWSAYFSRQVDAVGKILPTAALKGFVSESLEKLRVTFGKGALPKAVMDLLVGMVDVEAQESVIKPIRNDARSLLASPLGRRLANAALTQFAITFCESVAVARNERPGI